jgi:very-short-patch-repair endonuclease
MMFTFEKRLYAAILLLAALGVAASALDFLNLVPGLGGKSAPLLVGLLALILMAHYREISRVRTLTRGVKRSIERLSDARERQESPQKRSKAKKKKAKAKQASPKYREIAWHGLILRSYSEVKIARQLDLTGAMFLAGSKIRLKTERHRQTREVDFLVSYEGRWGVLEVDGPHHNREADEWRDARFQEHGLFVRRFPADLCYREPQKVVQQFLEELTMQMIEAAPPPAFVALPDTTRLLPSGSTGGPEIRVVKVNAEPDDVPDDEPANPTG